MRSTHEEVSEARKAYKGDCLAEREAFHIMWIIERYEINKHPNIPIDDIEYRTLRANRYRQKSEAKHGILPWNNDIERKYEELKPSIHAEVDWYRNS